MSLVSFIFANMLMVWRTVGSLGFDHTCLGYKIKSINLSLVKRNADMLTVHPTVIYFCFSHALCTFDRLDTICLDNNHNHF